MEAYRKELRRNLRRITWFSAVALASFALVLLMILANAIHI